MIAELLDGTLVLSASPGFGHQDAVLNLAVCLRQACPRGLRVLVGLTVRLGQDAELQPDVLVARYVDLVSDGLTAPPLLAVEVRAAGTGLLDQSLKKALYARHGIRSYWTVDPEVPELTAYELGPTGRYEVAGQASGVDVWEARQPFPVTLVPLELVAGLSPD
jgi:Uma2 family endonuclease